MLRRDKALRLIAMGVLFAFLSSTGLVFYKFIRCLRTVGDISSVDMYEPVQIYLFGSSGDSVSGNISLVNADSESIAQIERSWNSGSISIDFITVSLGKKKLSFPARIYGNSMASAHTGVSLQRFFLREGKCLLFSSGSRPLPEKEQRACYNLASFAFSPSAHMFGSVLKVQTVNLSFCVPGKTYSIRVESNGNLFLYPITD